MATRWEPKRPNEVRDYHHDWSLFLDGDTISTSTVTVAGVTKDSDSKTATAVTVWLSGGVEGAQATITNTIVTVGGRTETEVFDLAITSGEEPVTLPMAKAHLRVALADTSEDTLIPVYIRAARQWVEEFTGHILTPRTFVERFDAWGDYLTLYRQPVTDIDTITYDSATVDQDPFTDYAFSLGQYPLRIYPTSSFPSLRTNGYITVTYTAGYTYDVPDALVQAILLLVGHFFSTRSGVSIDSPEEVPLAVRSLCTPYRGLVMA